MTETTENRLVTLAALAKIGYDEYAASERRFMRSPEAWKNLKSTVQSSWAAGTDAIASRAIAATRLYDEREDDTPPPATDGDGQWLHIAFMGHVELTGLVTEITLGGQPAFHIDLPGKLWGGNPMAWEEYAGSALYSRRPVTEESIRKAWEAQRERVRYRAEWARTQEQRALESADGNDTDEEPAF
jgi:hypothetical protein